ncbi:MAG TPA: 6-pyruvoyl-tetrahydropterin synthase-related protein [Pyrinomonadaceae bacterium]|jgi:hypothetical protein
MKTYISELLENEKIQFLLILAVASAVMLPIFFRGVPFGVDIPHHFQCAFTFYEGIISGDFYPSWSLYRNQGFGAMELRLYPPLSHYSLALFYLATQNWHIAAWLTITFYSILGSLGVYLWAQELMPGKQAVFAGCVYSIIPYHLNQIYNAFLFAEFVGAAIIPFTFLFIYRVCNRGKIADVLGLAVSFAALVLTHLPLTVIGSICFLFYGLTLLQREKIFTQTLKLMCGVLLGTAASSFFWVKVLQERNFMAKASVYADPYLDYRLHFLLTPIQTFSGLAFDIYQNTTMFYDIMLLCAVVLVVACTLPFLFCRRANTEKIGRWNKSLNQVWLIFLISVFLTLPFSRPIWDNFQILQEVQFPWRWLTIACITASIISASYSDNFFGWFLDKRLRRVSMIVGGCILAIVTFSFSQIVRQSVSIAPESFETSIENYRQEKGFHFWWTIWAKREIFENKEKVSTENRSVQIEKWQPAERSFKISEGDGGFARIAAFYYPNWKANVNSLPVEITPANDGAIIVPITNKETVVDLYFQETNQVLIGQYVSCLTWFGTIAFFILSPLRKKFFANQFAYRL